ncbi:MAG: adenylate/guanylate cyclase domain-containing protein [Rhodospirillaceae bacterium]|nr:MAG: adenylate/guanylate cyclase domain-containing protein [Rhodospirillaceae bacterium]
MILVTGQVHNPICRCGGTESLTRLKGVIVLASGASHKEPDTTFMEDPEIAGGGVMKTERRLAAIASLDVVDYTRLMEADEAATHIALTACMRDVVEPLVASHHGHIFKFTGDGALVEFASAVDAVKCVFEIQLNLQQWNAAAAPERPIILRIGVNVGDVIFAEQDVYGMGVNVAARLQALAEPGTIFVSAVVVDHIHNQVDLDLDYIGQRRVKNVSEPIKVYRMRPGIGIAKPLPYRRRLPGWQRPRALAALILVLAGLALAIAWWQPWHLPSVFEPPNKPSIAVLPFDNLSPDAGQVYLAEGITEDLITNLAKFPDLYVIARNSSSIYTDKPIKVQQIRDDLGVSYVVEGSVQKAANSVRITAQLIDTETGEHIWAERYDRNLDKIFQIQDDVASAIAGTLTGTTGMLAAAELKRVSDKPPQTFIAYDYLMQGWHEWYKFTPEGNHAARRLFDIARKADPSYARAYAGLAWTYALDYEYDWTEDYKNAVEQALTFAKKAVQLGPKDYRSYWVLGWAYLYSWEHEQAEAAYNRARDMNPNDAELLAEMASLLIYIGRPEQAITQIKEAMRRNPFFDQWYVEYLGWAYQEAGRPQECIDTLEKIIDTQPTQEQLWLLRILAACYADPKVNRMADAQRTAKEILMLDPGFSMTAHRKYVEETLPYKSPQQIDRWIAAFSRVGLPK